LSNMWAALSFCNACRQLSGHRSLTVQSHHCPEVPNGAFSLDRQSSCCTVTGGCTKAPLFVVPQLEPLLAEKNNRYDPPREKSAITNMMVSWRRPLFFVVCCCITAPFIVPYWSLRSSSFALCNFAVALTPRNKYPNTKAIARPNHVAA
jgi:hypothetical protein